MIVGTVSKAGVPLINISLGGKEWPAVIDTGFNGDLELPIELKDRLQARYIGRIESLLAGGKRIEEDSYLVDFLFDGQLLQAETTFVNAGEMLIGTHLLQSHRLEIIFPRDSILIERFDHD